MSFALVDLFTNDLMFLWAGVKEVESAIDEALINLSIL